jgi:hypothetical protein
MNHQQYTRGMLISQGGGGSVVFQYNPYEWDIDKSVDWKEVPAAGREQGYLEYGCGHPRKVTLNIEVSKDCNSEYFVMNFFNAIMSMTRPSQQGMGAYRPGAVQFIMGASFSMTAVIEKVKIRFAPRKGNNGFYMADPVTLLPKEGTVTVILAEYI